MSTIGTQFDQCVNLVIEARLAIGGKEAEIGSRKNAIRLIKQNLDTRLVETARQLNKEDQIEFAELLYWHSEVSVATICDLMGVRGIHCLLKMIGGLPSGQFCAWCFDERIFEDRGDRKFHEDRNREQERKGLARIPWLCEQCSEERSRQSKVEREKQQEAIAAQIQAYKTMPYREYLKTEHWQTVRKSALKRGGYRCQLCNAGGVLDVHHNTYERRGEEDATDVIVLCRSCHDKFHAKEADNG